MLICNEVQARAGIQDNSKRRDFHRKTKAENQKATQKDKTVQFQKLRKFNNREGLKQTRIFKS